jgi:hypothetical protein
MSIPQLKAMVGSRLPAAPAAFAFPADPPAMMAMACALDRLADLTGSRTPRWSCAPVPLEAAHDRQSL